MMFCSNNRNAQYFKFFNKHWYLCAIMDAWTLVFALIFINKLTHMQLLKISLPHLIIVLIHDLPKAISSITSAHTQDAKVCKLAIKVMDSIILIPVGVVFLMIGRTFQWTRFMFRFNIYARFQYYTSNTFVNCVLEYVLNNDNDGDEIKR
eukprot:377766_1